MGVRLSCPAALHAPSRYFFIACDMTICIYVTGGHLGRNKTYFKISERFYWKSMWQDVTSYLKTCEVCQSTNDAKFVKEAVPLHPNTVKPEVWRQVN